MIRWGLRHRCRLHLPEGELKDMSYAVSTREPQLLSLKPQASSLVISERVYCCLIARHRQLPCWELTRRCLLGLQFVSTRTLMHVHPKPSYVGRVRESLMPCFMGPHSPGERGGTVPLAFQIQLEIGTSDYHSTSPLSKNPIMSGLISLNLAISPHHGTQAT